MRASLGIASPNLDLLEADRLYQAAFNRIPDAGGLSYWTHALLTGTPATTVAADFLGSAEFQAYGALTNAAFVDAICADVLGRTPDAGGQCLLDFGPPRGRVASQRVVGVCQQP